MREIIENSVLAGILAAALLATGVGARRNVFRFAVDNAREPRPAESAWDRFHHASPTNSETDRADRSETAVGMATHCA